MAPRHLKLLIVCLALGLTLSAPAGPALAAHSPGVSIQNQGNGGDNGNQGNGGGKKGQGNGGGNDCNGNSQGRGNNPACEAPEAPMSIALPLTALVVLGGYVVLMRRRDARDVAPGGIPE